MKPPKKEPNFVKVDEVVVRWVKRADGRFKVYWREAGRPKSSTAMDLAGAKELARRKAKDLSGRQGGRVMTLEDAELVRRLKEVAGQRSPFALLAEVEDAVKELGSWDHVGKAVQHYKASGMATVKREEYRVIKRRFLDLYDKKSRWTLAGLRKASTVRPL